ncbi:hypothetical protein DFP73DRAFT_117523 [Morchella snyderi]|nr:hypothetical protein DFP73DRAFT_117523 [Morchella snyderi]
MVKQYSRSQGENGHWVLADRDSMYGDKQPSFAFQGFLFVEIPCPSTASVRLHPVSDCRYLHGLDDEPEAFRVDIIRWLSRCSAACRPCSLLCAILAQIFPMPFCARSAFRLLPLFFLRFAFFSYFFIPFFCSKCGVCVYMCSYHNYHFTYIHPSS